jgi:transposase
MSHEIRADYNQVLMFPPCIEDWVQADHPARFVREFVDTLDLPGLGFRARESEEGRPNYAVDLLLKVWIYGFLEKIRSTRKLEKACKEHLGFIWLTGMHAPDHSSLWRFWRDNREGIRRVFRQTVEVAMKAELIGLVVHAVDGTKLAAQCSTRGLWDKERLEKILRELDEALDGAMGEVEAAEEKELGEYRLPEGMTEREQLRETIRAKLGELEAAGRERMHPGEREAEVMKTSEGKRLGYNAQVVVDDKAGLIVAAEVTTEQNDRHQLVPMLEAVEATVGELAQKTVADSGYVSGEELTDAEAFATDVVVSLNGIETQEKQGGPFHTSKFSYDKERDVWVCPQGQVLTYEGTTWGQEKPYPVRRYRCHRFKDCPVRWECSKDRRGRKVEMSPYYTAILRQKAKQAEGSNRELIRKRMGIVEPVFAWIKQNMGFRRWTVRGLEKVRTQWAFICAVVNLQRMYLRWAAGELRLS